MQHDRVAVEHGAGIAIIGMGCILPAGVDSPDELWTFLCEGGDGISEVPPERWNNAAVYDPDPGIPGKAATRWGGFVAGIAEFDAGFFGISPREAAVMDPQQRMLLETAWRALEDAGLQVERLAGSRTGVYIGISHSDYHGIQKYGRFDIDVHTSTGGALSIAANRLSHRFDLRGPSLSVDTACSSSLVALDLACSGLKTGECDIALVGGVNAILTPDVTITFSRASMLSPDGRCKTFDERANGYVRGEGAGVVVLKPMARALADRDRIHAVIRATAVNQDGRTATITVPNVQAQIDMLHEVCRRAAVSPGRVGYVEAHGTGTAVGDPIEAEAIGKVFGRRHRPESSCLIGSIKTNIGHLEPAAGIAGLIKTALCVNKGAIPASLHFEKPNPKIPFTELGIEVCRDHSRFPEASGSRLAVVNSFGFGGTNACAILEQPPTLLPRVPDAVASLKTPVLLPLSGPSRTSLERAAEDLANHIDSGRFSLQDVAGTLALRRSHLDHRMVLLAHSREDATASLRAFAAKEARPGVIAGRRGPEPQFCFVFTGQGAHWWGMGRNLLASDAVFRAAIEQCDGIFSELANWSLLDQFTCPEIESRIDQTVVAQPTTFALQVGLAARWREWGITPKAVIGHSIGEMAAAYVSGALPLEDAIRVVYHRSRLQEQVRFQGAMAAVGMSEQEAAKFLAEAGFDLEIAAVNAPELVTVAGASHEVQRLLDELAIAHSGVFARQLRVDYAFHSRQMDAFETELRTNLKGLESRLPAIPMISTVTGKPVEATELGADYWWRNMRRPVLFSAAVEIAIIDAGLNTFVELGAHPVLTGPVRSCLAHAKREGVVVASLYRDEPDEHQMAKAFAELHITGARVDWDQAVANWNFLPLPRQRFEKALLWAESEESRSARMDGPVHPLLGYRLKTAHPLWQTLQNAQLPRFLGDHVVDGTCVFPAAAFVELFLAACRQIWPDGPWELEGIRFHDALIIGSDSSVFLQTSVNLARGHVEVTSRVRGSEAWEVRASAHIRVWSGTKPPLSPWQPKITPPESIERARFYRQLREEGHEFGPAFQGVESIWREPEEVLGAIRLPRTVGSAADYLVHPVVLDSCFQTIRGFRGFDDGESAEDRALTLPISIGRMRFFRPAGECVLARASAVTETPTHIVADITILNESGDVVGIIEQFCCRLVKKRNAEQIDTGDTLYAERWIELPPLSSVKTGANASETWIVLGGERGVAESCAALAEQRGIRIIRVRPGLESRPLGDDCYESTPDFDGIKELLQSIDEPVARIIHLWALTQDRGPRPLDADAIALAQRLGSEPLMALGRVLAEMGATPRLVIATAGAIAVPQDDTYSERSILHAAMLGIARTIANELPETRPLIIDLDPQPELAEELLAQHLLTEILCESSEMEIAIRGDVRYGCRLERLREGSLPAKLLPWNSQARSPAFRVTMSNPGVLENLILTEIAEPRPAAGEVLIEVHAAGLNFRDVMAATGLLPAEAEPEPAWQRLGLECSGFVREVGEGVDCALKGQRVVAVVPGSFASHICAPASLVFPIPDRFSFGQAAALPTAYATAYHALVSVGRLRPGDIVLVHAATGGVGLAAAAVAKQYGGEVIATAGSPEKRSYLHQLGVAHVFDSRSLSFADGVMTVTQGRGVDIVLNSLPGPFIEKGLSVLAPGGRFLEIGKRDIYDDKPIGLRSLRRNAAFFAIDLAQLAAERPDLLRVEIEKVFADLGAGRLDPLPIVEFPLNRAADAFRHMASAQHIGKVVLSFDNCSAMIGVAAASPTVTSDGVYVVTGGLRGFGLETARWLVSEGARHLVLAGRTGANDPDTKGAVAELRSVGAEIIPVAADVSEDEGARRVLTEATKVGRPIRGIIHAAAVINASLLANLDVDQVRSAFAPKVLGAWRLHALTRKMPLDFFICYSSLATHLGSVGQAHYAGANRAVEALAAIRRAQGLPSLTVAWGAIGDAGYLTRRTDVARYLRQSGVSQVPAQRALTTMGRLLRHDCHCVLAGNVQWSAVGRAIPALAANPRTRQLCSSAGDSGHSDRYFRSQLLDCAEQARTPMLLGFLRDQVATVLKVGGENVEMNRPLAELGLDSLTSFELKNKVEAELGMALTIGAFLQKPTLQSIAGAILERFDTAATLGSDAAGPSGHASVATMSLGQQALWFVDRLAPGSPAYVLAMCIAIRPRLDPELFNAAYQQVVARHDCLRLRFPADARGPVPEWLDWTAFKTTFADVAHWDEARLRGEIDREANSPFELAVGPLVELRHYRRADRDVLLLKVHHIVADAMSITLVAEQILEAYLALRANAPIRWSRQARPYGTYVKWQKSIVSGAAAEAHLRFWREQLADAPIAFDLPTDHPRPASQRGPGAATKIIIPTEVTQRLTLMARARGVTLFTLLLTAFNVLLHRLSGQTDLVVGILTSGRVQPDLQDCVGYLVNPVPVRSRIDPAESFESLLASVDSTVRAVLEHQEFPFPRIVQDLGLARDSSRSPAFQVLFAMERSGTIDAQGFAVTLLNTEGASVDIGGFKIEAVATKRDRAQFDLTFVVEEFNGDIFGIVDYRTDLWEQSTIELFIAQFNAILRQLARTTAVPVSDITLGIGEGRPLVGPPLKDVPDIIDSICRAAQAHGDRIALTACDGEWTYRELMEMVTRTAATLNHRGIEAGDLVGICLPRVGALPMALLAVLCGGAAYLPLDRNNPLARLARILADAEPDCIITDRDGAVLLGPYVRCQLLLIDELLAPALAAPPVPPRSFRAGDLAYVIHTSGSTGGPLGVEVSRGALSNFVAAIAGELPLAATDALLAVTTISFDIAALELFLPLMIGGRVVLADEATCADGTRLMARLRQGVTFMQGTPAAWQMLLDAGWRGDAKLTALCGGERLHRPLANELLARVGSLWNLYGPTETTIWSTCGQVFPDALPPSIGRPIANTTCYVVGQNFKLVPPGVVGELLIAGSGVARGYRNNPSRTADRFIANPFDRLGETTCFRTGDFVRVDREGALIYVGRRDQQVKLRGFRIELAEVESALLSHGAVREAAAVVQGNDLASVHIAAYVTANIELGSLTEYVRTCLPPYMVPASLTVLDEFPRLANGKLDRARLAAQPPRDRGRATMPRSETERTLLAILTDVLGTDEVGVDDDFFAVGGTSLLGMRYLARASEVFNVNLGPDDLLVAPMVTSMAQRISTLQRVHQGGGEQTLVPEQMPLRELWRPLALVRAEGGLPAVRAAAIAYLPEEISGSELYRSFVKTAERDALDPYWIGTCSLDAGAIALIMLPLSGRDLFADSRRTKAMVEQGVACAARLGARSVALTGLIPAATDLGLGLHPVEGTSVTTGHAVTAVAMSLTVRSVLAAAGRDLRRERVCFVGLGGIGTVTLRMMLLACMEHPQSLVLCDVPAKQAVLDACVQEAGQAYGFRGKVTTCLSRRQLPDEAYGATLLVAATNAQRVIDIARLRPGTIIVDDSFPLCFDVAAARRRFEAAADILFVSGGSLNSGALKWDFALPPAVPANARGALVQTLLPPASMITGCILSSVLNESHGLRATLGQTTTTDLVDAWNCVSRLGITAAPLHCGTWAPSTQDIARFRSRLSGVLERSAKPGRGRAVH